jgi:hypothetical protein
MRFIFVLNVHDEFRMLSVICEIVTSVTSLMKVMSMFIAVRVSVILYCMFGKFLLTVIYVRDVRVVCYLRDVCNCRDVSSTPDITSLI